MTSLFFDRYYLTGPKVGHSEVFTSNLPGYPDNIKLSKQGTFFVGMGSVRFEGSSPFGPFLDIVAPYPEVKKLITKVCIDYFRENTWYIVVYV